MTPPKHSTATNDRCGNFATVKSKVDILGYKLGKELVYTTGVYSADSNEIVSTVNTPVNISHIGDDLHSVRFVKKHGISSP